MSSNYVEDVQSALQITTSATAAQCGGGTQLLGLAWNLSPTTNTYQTVVSYSEVKKGTTYLLRREYCANGASPTATSKQDRLLRPPGEPAAARDQPQRDQHARDGWMDPVAARHERAVLRHRAAERLHLQPLGRAREQLAPEHGGTAHRRGVEHDVRIRRHGGRDGRQRHLRQGPLLRRLLGLQRGGGRRTGLPGDGRGDPWRLHAQLLHERVGQPADVRRAAAHLPRGVPRQHADQRPGPDPALLHRPRLPRLDAARERPGSARTVVHRPRDVPDRQRIRTHQHARRSPTSR